MATACHTANSLSFCSVLAKQAHLVTRGFFTREVVPFATKSKAGDTIIEGHATIHNDLPLQASAAEGNGTCITRRICTGPWDLVNVEMVWRPSFGCLGRTCRIKGEKSWLH